MDQLKSIPIASTEYNNDSYEITATQNEKFDIVLDGNITTGYSWILTSDSLQNLTALNIDEHKSGEYTTDPQPIGMCGAPGKFHFKFEPKNAGTEILNFQYKRPWETNYHYNMTVIVKIE